MPYQSLPPTAFWRHCRESRDFAADALYTPRIEITQTDRIATAGSCFAQNVGRYLRRSNAQLLDVEQAPPGMSVETGKRFGYGLYSGRYGNIYTTRQLRQLLQDVQAPALHSEAIWTRGDRYFDALRPTVEPEGLQSEEEVGVQRLDHLARLRAMFQQTDLFIFTLGLTEYWAARDSGLVFPTCPGVVAGQYDPGQHVFGNAEFGAVYDDLSAALTLLRRFNPAIKMLLTVSPVPLTATNAGEHVLAATTYSKSVLRAVAGQFVNAHSGVDYFPSYEIFTAPPFGGRFYAENLRQVTEEGVSFAMSLFFAAHSEIALQDAANGAGGDMLITGAGGEADEAVCEEVLLEAYRS